MRAHDPMTPAVGRLQPATHRATCPRCETGVFARSLMLTVQALRNHVRDEHRDDWWPAFGHRDMAALYDRVRKVPRQS